MIKNTTPNGQSQSGFQAHGELIPGLKKAISIVESRQATAKALIYDEVYCAAFEDVLVFLKAELFRQEHPDQASYTTTAEFK